MFYAPRSNCPFIVSFICFLAVVFITSCRTNLFLVPQPIDQKNIETFPKAFRGQWFEDVENNGEGDSYLISKKNVAIITHGSDTIVKGFWPQKDNYGTYVELPFTLAAFNTIRYDSLKNPLDTVENYFIKDSLIFELDASGLLSKGYFFDPTGDSIILIRKDTTYIDLGKNAFLRKLNRRFYMLNIRNSVLGESWAKANDWWHLILIETTGRSTFNIWDQGEKFKQLPCMFYPKDTLEYTYYYNCRWTTEELLGLIKDGYFEAGSTVFKKSD